MKGKANSIYDLAKLTGVSYATVSRVLNGRGNTSPEARRLVLQAASKHNFHPKMKARKTTVALLIDINADGARKHYIQAILSSLVEKLSRHDVTIEIFTNANISQFRECYVDGVIAMPWNDRVVDLLRGMREMPKATINYSEIEGCSNVSSAHFESGRMAAEHLLARGHGKAGIIVASRDFCNMRRVEGFMSHYKENGVELDSMLCGFISDNSPLAVVNQLLSRKPTAIFFGLDDSMEIWSIASGIKKIPDELSAIAMENEIYSRFTQPPMTTINPQLERVVEKAAELIMEKVAAKDPSPEMLAVENQLIERQSVAAIENTIA